MISWYHFTIYIINMIISISPVTKVGTMIMISLLPSLSPVMISSCHNNYITCHKSGQFNHDIISMIRWSYIMHKSGCSVHDILISWWYVNDHDIIMICHWSWYRICHDPWQKCVQWSWYHNTTWYKPYQFPQI